MVEIRAWRHDSMAVNAVEITDANFDETILNADKPALVDFWAVWCGPCRVIGPIVEELAAEYGDRVVVGKLDVDANRDTAVKYGIQAIPTLLLVNKAGQPLIIRVSHHLARSAHNRQQFAESIFTALSGGDALENKMGKLIIYKNDED
jgi:thioredoxin 1